jgi:hypothetical protein
MSISTTIQIRGKGAVTLRDRVAQIMAEEGISLDEILTVLNEERERYYQERYAGD